PTRVRDLAPPAIRPALPPEVMAAARTTFDRIGIDDRMALGVAFDRLVGYFRSFEAKEPPPPSGDVSRDLVDHKAGVCRHRSFGFVITASALGLPTRYVTNEAHAFVEVWFPELGWQRI